jgi:Na+-transporting methylmalonyl-CoA/oxaloacetate decarboxylase gamma subunit
MGEVFGLVGVLIIALIGMAFLSGRSKLHGRPAPRFTRKQFLTANEARVLPMLEAALPQHRIMAQVAMSALLQADEPDRKQAKGTRNRFAQKVVDFVIVSRDTAEVLALVELDDRTHNVAKDQRRDAMTAAAGYRTIRIPGRPHPTFATVREAVVEFAPVSTGGGSLGRRSASEQV